MEKGAQDLRTQIDNLNENLGTPGRYPPAPAAFRRRISASATPCASSKSLNLKGTVNTLPDAKGWLFVTLRHHADEGKTFRISKRSMKPDITDRDAHLRRKIRMQKSASAATEINFSGMTVDEVRSELDGIWTIPAMAHLENVRIVHGTGAPERRTGIP